MIFIPGNTPSLKNSKRIISIGGRPRLIPSKTVVAYQKETAGIFELYRNQFRLEAELNTLPGWPVIVAFKFVRGSRRRFDQSNACQVIEDLMVKNHWLPDDNADILLPFFLPHEYDKDRPGCEVSVIDTVNYATFVEKIS